MKLAEGLTHEDTLIVARAVLAYPESGVRLKQLAFTYLHETIIDLRPEPGRGGRRVREDNGAR
jgi:hypothetical protein